MGFLLSPQGQYTQEHVHAARVGSDRGYSLPCNHVEGSALQAMQSEKDLRLLLSRYFGELVNGMHLQLLLAEFAVKAVIIFYPAFERDARCRNCELDNLISLSCLFPRVHKLHSICTTS